MTTFDKREKGFENKFAHDEEIAFRIRARAHKLLGLWAAGKRGLDGAGAEGYAKALVMADFEPPANGDIVVRLLRDFAAAKLKVGEKDIRLQMEQCMAEARAQLGGAS